MIEKKQGIGVARVDDVHADFFIRNYVGISTWIEPGPHVSEYICTLDGGTDMVAGQSTMFRHDLSAPAQPGELRKPVVLPVQKDAAYALMLALMELFGISTNDTLTGDYANLRDDYNRVVRENHEHVQFNREIVKDLLARKAAPPKVLKRKPTTEGN